MTEQGAPAGTALGGDGGDQDGAAHGGEVSAGATPPTQERAIKMNISSRASFVYARLALISLCIAILTNFLIYFMASICLIKPMVSGISYISDFVAILVFFGISMKYGKAIFALALSSICLICVFLAYHFIDIQRVYFDLNKGFYLQQLSHTDVHKRPFVIFKWKEGFGFPAGGAWEYFVYDAASQIDLATDRRDKNWEKLYGGYLSPFNRECSIRIRKMEPKFYYILQRC